MQKIILLLLWVTLMSWCATSPQVPKLKIVHRITNPYLLLTTIPMIGLIGLRTRYNDTVAYRTSFENAPSLVNLVQDPDRFNWLNNPLFELYTSFVRELTDNYHIYFMLVAIFVMVLMLKFFWEVAEKDTYPLMIFSYLTLGTYFFALAAMKQALAMSILCHGILSLSRRKYIRFLLIVFIAGLVHTYAWFSVILLLLTGRPWKLRTYGVIAVTLFVMFNFRESITTLLEYGDAIGKTAAEDQVFSGEGMNMIRVLVYSIVPVCSFVFRPVLEPKMERKHYILLHMSIVSFMFMLLASVDGANMFGRMARYFEVGTICMFPWMIRHLFEKKSRFVVSAAYIAAFTLFAVYQYRSFDTYYGSITWLAFFKSLF